MNQKRMQKSGWSVNLREETESAYAGDNRRLAACCVLLGPHGARNTAAQYSLLGDAGYCLRPRLSRSDRERKFTSVKKE